MFWQSFEVWFCNILNLTCERFLTDEVLGQQWDKCNVVVLSCILNSILDDFYLDQIYSKNATDVKETYDKLDGSINFYIKVFILHLNVLNFSFSKINRYHKYMGTIGNVRNETDLTEE